MRIEIRLAKKFDKKAFIRLTLERDAAEQTKMYLEAGRDFAWNPPEAPKAERREIEQGFLAKALRRPKRYAVGATRMGREARVLSDYIKKETGIYFPSQCTANYMREAVLRLKNHFVKL